MGEDSDGKTDNLQAILVKAGETFSRINGEYSSFFSSMLLAPAPHEDDDNLEEALSKKRIQHCDEHEADAVCRITNPVHLLMGGDAEVLIWERLWGTL